MQSSKTMQSRTKRSTYTAVISFIDDCCDKPHLRVEHISAPSSREALTIARRRSRRLRTGDIQIVRGPLTVTGVYSPKPNSRPAHFCDEETMWTEEETSKMMIGELRS